MADFTESSNPSGLQSYWLTSNDPGKYKSTRKDKELEIELKKKKFKKALAYYRQVVASFS